MVGGLSGGGGEGDMGGGGDGLTGGWGEEAGWEVVGRRWVETRR